MKIAKERIEILQVCKLIKHVRDNKKEEIEKLVVQGIEGVLNYIEPKDGLNALMVAATNNNDQLVTHLLELKADPNVQNNIGMTALMIASHMGHVQSVKALLKFGANTLLYDTFNKGPLFYSLIPTNRHYSCVELLLSHKADANNCSSNGTPLLNEACEISHEIEGICRLLINAYVDVKTQDKKTGYTPLMAACRAGSVSIVELLLQEGADSNCVTRTLKTAAHEAAENNHLECLFILSAYGTKFNVNTNSGDNPMHLAAKNGHSLCIRYLVQRGCSPKTKNNTEFTPRLYAKEFNHKEALKECKKAEKAFGKVDSWCVCMYDFCQVEKVNLINLFEKYDTERYEDENAPLSGKVTRDDFLVVLDDCRVPMIGDNTAIKNSLMETHDKLNTKLIDYNEFISGKKYLGKTYLRASYLPKAKKKKGGKGKKSKVKNNMSICVQEANKQLDTCGPYLPFIMHYRHYTDQNRFDRERIPDNPLQDDSFWYINKPEPQYIPLNDAARYNEINSINEALKCGMDIDEKNDYFKTPLMITACSGNLSMVKYLLEKGANVNERDNMYWTPLHFACHGGCIDIVKLLVENGAIIDALSMNGATPLHRAIETSSESIVQYLMSKGAKLQLDDSKIKTVLEEAQTWADPRVYEMIAKKWSSLPPPNEKKNNDKNDKKTDKLKKPETKVYEKPTDWFESYFNRKRESITKTVAALVNLDDEQDITHMLEKDWVYQDSIKHLINMRVVNRERFGWMYDFNDYEKPFMQNLTRLVDNERDE